MAIIQKEKMYLNGAQFTRVLKCDASGRFTCELPANVAEALGDPSDPSGRTRDECIRAWEAFVRDYMKLRTETREMLYYDYVDAVNMSFTKGVGFALAVCRVTETRTETETGEVTYRYKPADWDELRGAAKASPPVRTLYDPLKTLIERTPENEEFFLSMIKGVIKLTDKLDALTRSSDGLQAVISNPQEAALKGIPVALTHE